ncbi:MAG: right-handed parallel beta-helix repeat-containing protein [Candidatus Krumholzibacteria bacterium]|nr:right-handed parallel beta-helix repeat-containing protein [Candidatus Krumholzibacteria bacterium]
MTRSPTGTARVRLAMAAVWAAMAVFCPLGAGAALAFDRPGGAPARWVRVEVASAGELAAAVGSLSRGLPDGAAGVEIALAPGDYHLSPQNAVDSTCGNCEDPARPVPVTAGLRVSGTGIYLVGDGRGEAVIHTHAGYGIWFDGCRDCGLSGLTVTGGERDTAQAATDAAIVVQRSSVVIADCVIRDNIGDAETIARVVVGIMGVCGREESFTYLRNCEILRNSWDGVALYRDAEAVIERNVIDGIDGAGRAAGGGRGVGIGVTWNARAVIEKNLVRRYWKGVGIFVDADVEMRVNFIERMRAWGIAYWDAGRGSPRAVIDENVVYDCGACGISVTRAKPFAADETPGRLTRNIVVHTAQNPDYDDPEAYCHQCALALHAVPEGFYIAHNLYYDNRRANEDLFQGDTAREMFWRKRRAFVRKYRNTPIGVGGRLNFHDSFFLQRYTRR